MAYSFALVSGILISSSSALPSCSLSSSLRPKKYKHGNKHVELGMQFPLPENDENVYENKSKGETKSRKLNYALEYKSRENEFTLQ